MADSYPTESHVLRSEGLHVIHQQCGCRNERKVGEGRTPGPWQTCLSRVFADLFCVVL